MMEVAAKDIEKLGGTVELKDIGKQKVRCMMVKEVSIELENYPSSKEECVF